MNQNILINKDMAIQSLQYAILYLKQPVKNTNFDSIIQDIKDATKFIKTTKNLLKLELQQ